jgi:hypothetical protein
LSCGLTVKSLAAALIAHGDTLVSTHRHVRHTRAPGEVLFAVIWQQCNMTPTLARVMRSRDGEVPAVVAIRKGGATWAEVVTDEDRIVVKPTLLLPWKDQ